MVHRHVFLLSVCLVWGCWHVFLLDVSFNWGFWHHIMFVLLSGLKKCTNALFGVCLFWGRSNMFLGLGYSCLIIIIFFFCFRFWWISWRVFLFIQWHLNITNLCITKSSISITNDFLPPGQNYSKMYGTEPRFNEIHERKRQHVIKDECQTDQQG